MKYIELITLSNFEKNKCDYEETLKSEGFQFETNDYSIILRMEFIPYSEGNFSYIQNLFEQRKMVLRARRSISTEYEDADYARADFIFPLFPTIYTNEIKFTSKCKTCGSHVTKIDYEKKVRQVKSNKPVLSVNGDVDIVNIELKEKLIEMGFKGVSFFQFDLHGKYFSLSSNVDLGPHIFKESETINLRKDTCPECSKRKFDMYYGPFRYNKKNYNGEDFAKIRFPFSMIVCSQKAYEIFKKFEKKTIIDALIFLE